MILVIITTADVRVFKCKYSAVREQHFTLLPNSFYRDEVFFIDFFVESLIARSRLETIFCLNLLSDFRFLCIILNNMKRQRFCFLYSVMVFLVYHKILLNFTNFQYLF